jgi:signal transduction histidine kinase
VGFEPERAAAVFGDFYQVDASETRHFGGLGLGLALVRRIVDELGGDAVVESTPGQGAAFHLLLPAAGDGGQDGGPDRDEPGAPEAPPRAGDQGG